MQFTQIKNKLFYLHDACINIALVNISKPVLNTDHFCK